MVQFFFLINKYLIEQSQHGNSIYNLGKNTSGQVKK